jgi:hypothetical protein
MRLGAWALPKGREVKLTQLKLTQINCKEPPCFLALDVVWVVALRQMKEEAFARRSRIHLRQGYGGQG